MRDDIGKMVPFRERIIPLSRPKVTVAPFFVADLTEKILQGNDGMYKTSDSVADLSLPFASRIGILAVPLPRDMFWTFVPSASSM